MNYIKSPKVHKQQSGMTIDERAALFNRKFKIKSMPKGILRRLFRENDITFKKVKKTKIFKKS